MKPVNRIVECDYDREVLINFIREAKLPFTASIVEGHHRTTEQNKLQRLWVNEIAAQLGDQTAEEVRGYCKLAFGVPILREENEAFRFMYDRIVKPMQYEQKLALMMEPFDFGVTRIMNTRQKTEYLNRMLRHFSGAGLHLTIPPDRTLLKIA